MSIFVIGDLHLSFHENKPMSIFGDNWEGHEEKIKKDWRLTKMLKFDSEAFIKEMESLEGVEETPLDYEEFEQEEYERMNERDLRGGI